MEKTFRIKRQWAEQWIDALESADYEQGTGSLCEQGKYCCLGVLTEEVRQELADIACVINEFNKRGYGKSKEGDLLPKEIIDEAGITTMSGEPTENPLLGPHAAAAWNDDYNLNFAGIASLIKIYGEWYD